MHGRLKLVEGQARAGLSKATLLETAAKAFAASIGTHGVLDMAGQEEVTYAVVTDDWTGAQKGMLVTILSQEAIDADRVGTRKTQSCPSIEAFFPNNMWQTMENADISLPAKLKALAEFLQEGLNISRPAIPLLQRLIAILTAVHPGIDLETTQWKEDAAKTLQGFIKEAIKINGR